MKRKGLVLIIVLILCLVVAGCSQGTPSNQPSQPTQEQEKEQEKEAIKFPTQAVTIVVGATPGGGFDLQARMFANFWSKYLDPKYAFAVSNVDGGGGIVAANQVWVAKPDGHTIKQIKAGPYLQEQLLNPDVVRYDMLKWKYIGQYTVDNNALIARKKVAENIKSWGDFTSYADPLTFSAAGVGSQSHNKALAVAIAADLKMRFIQYPGNPEMFAGMMRAEGDFTVYSIASSKDLDPEEFTILCVLTDERSKILPDVPSALEFGMPKAMLDGVVNNPAFTTPRAYAVPPDTPDEVVQLLIDSFMAVCADPEFQQQMEDAGVELVVMDGHAFTEKVKQMKPILEAFVPLLEEQKK